MYLISIDLIPIITTEIIGPPEVCEDVADISYTIAAVEVADSYSWNYTLVSTLVQDGSNSASFPSIAPGGSLSVTATNRCGTSAPSSINIVEASEEVCGLATCVRENTFVDTELSNLLGNQLLMRVSEVISANITLPEGGSARFIAGQSIDLYPGLQIANQAVFIAEIQSCDLVEELIQSIQKK